MTPPRVYSKPTVEISLKSKKEALILVREFPETRYRERLLRQDKLTLIVEERIDVRFPNPDDVLLFHNGHQVDLRSPNSKNLRYSFFGKRFQDLERLAPAPKPAQPLKL